MNDSRLILLRQERHILSLLLNAGRLTEVNVYPSAAGTAAALNADICTLGSIYAGKINHVVKNINAAFVDLTQNRRAFLPLDGKTKPRLLNRPYDGRLLAGDEILVQVEREAVKTKDPVVTAELSFSGRYAVLIPSEAPGRLVFSGKLDTAAKKRLKEYLPPEELTEVLKNASLIIRTNAGELTESPPLVSDIRRLAALAEQVLSIADKRTCYSCLYRPARPYLMEIRDTYTDQYDTIITDDRELYEETADFLRAQYPEELSRLQFYEDSRVSLFNLYGLTAKLKEATETRVWLKSGGYLVIEPTEALTVIDVNSGKYSGKKGIRDTFRLINREAALEIARQLRLRNLSGIILVDFINMEEADDRQNLLDFLSAQLKRDPVKTALIDMTPLGLVEITRKKIRRPLKEQLEQ